MASVSPAGALRLDAKETELARRLVAHLGQAGVCPRCVLRFVGVGEPAQYARPQADVWAELQRAAGVEAPAPLCAEVGACCVCLGVLAFADDATATVRLLDELASVALRSSAAFGFDVALPPSLLVRQRGMFLDASSKVGRDLMPRNDGIIEVKSVLKWHFSDRVGALLGARRDDSSPYHVTLNVDHPLSQAESEAVVETSETERADKRQRLQHRPHVEASASSVRSVLKALFEPDCRARLESAKLCPPTAASAPCELRLSASHASICIGGRYNKLSREMPQTPWWLDGDKKGISSVQEQLEPLLLQAYKASSSTFHGAGREDMDVRMLGNGRPFVLELNAPTEIALGVEAGTLLAEVEAELNRVTEHVQVRELRVVPPSQIAGLVREGQAEHRKAYRCVVWLSRAVTAAEVLAKLDGAGAVRLEQKTPIRVLHRRPLLTRPRTVFSMRSELLNAHFLQLDLVTQAGTYVKEFVHGDFGRTFPNLGSLLGCAADILQLDVLDVLDPETNDS
ncbi:hypothetical protein T492DRAFT_908289 [Pavlovales sp. CCMP2436]|nr:hypothetical protein T492DRAFT_908289 [Pavlovales sp. CCMP2436]|mmetsp:Transcript_43121/g.101212  ORF Transcript_43121/g.101212 Transcript_43121/m.101212 type:complete len:511 (-) Transcript_43121:148-1680(-)